MSTCGRSVTMQLPPEIVERVKCHAAPNIISLVLTRACSSLVKVMTRRRTETPLYLKDPVYFTYRNIVWTSEVSDYSIAHSYTHVTNKWKKPSVKMNKTKQCIRKNKNPLHSRLHYVVSMYTYSTFLSCLLMRLFSQEYVHVPLHNSLVNKFIWKHCCDRCLRRGSNMGCVWTTRMLSGNIPLDHGSPIYGWNAGSSPWGRFIQPTDVVILCVYRTLLHPWLNCPGWSAACEKIFSQDMYHNKKASANINQGPMNWNKLYIDICSLWIHVEQWITLSMAVTSVYLSSMLRKA